MGNVAKNIYLGKLPYPSPSPVLSMSRLYREAEAWLNVSIILSFYHAYRHHKKTKTAYMGRGEFIDKNAH